MGIINLPDNESKIMLIKMLTKLERKHEYSEKFKKEMENVRKHQNESQRAKEFMGKLDSDMQKNETGLLSHTTCRNQFKGA